MGRVEQGLNESGSKALNRLFWPGVVLLLSLMATLQGVAAYREVQVWDEGLHLAAGYSYLKTGDFRMGHEQPPLGKVLCALPLLLWDPDLPTEHESWRQADEIVFGEVFLYDNRVHADHLLWTARAVTMLLTLLLGLVIALWTRRHFGTGPALLAVFLFSLDPNFIAHGHYVTTDLIAALTIFLACVAWFAYLETRRVVTLVLAALAFGLGVVSKFSAVVLLPVFMLLYLVRAWQQQGSLADVSSRSRLGAGRFVLSLLTVGAVGWLVIGAAYWPATRDALQGKIETRLASLANREAVSTELLGRLAERLDLPAHPFLIGLHDFLEHSENGHEGYLLGQLSKTGWWYYFPVVFAVKTPAALLWLMSMSLVAGLAAWRRPGDGRLQRLRGLPGEWALLTVPPLIYFAGSMASHINIGVRHILPVYPFLFVSVAVVLGKQARQRRWVLAGVLLALPLQGFELARVHPHYLAFFNTPAGGSENGHRYLLDSNIDWGQDMKYLKTHLDAIGAESACFCYFGKAAAWYYGVNMEHLPTTAERDARAELDCVAAISVTPLFDLYVPRGSYDWLKELRPDAKIGHSIYVYDLRKNRLPNSGAVSVQQHLAQ